MFKHSSIKPRIHTIKKPKLREKHETGETPRSMLAVNLAAAKQQKSRSVGFAGKKKVSFSPNPKFFSTLVLQWSFMI